MSTDKPTQVAFTQKQWDYLNQQFPERTSYALTAEELRFYSGQRAMVMFIKDRIQKG